MKILNRIAVGLACVAMAGVALAQQNTQPTWVFARNYAGLSLIGQQANTYTFNGGVCGVAPSVPNGNSPNFFAFSGLIGSTTVYFPIAIIDANPAVNEIVTPTSTTQGASTCGFAASTANSHTSFTLTDGTIGLQPAIVSQLQTAPPFNVLLDQYWYNQVYGLPGLPTPESLIKAATGTTSVQVVDTTTSPWTYWRWSGTAYAAVSLTGGASAPTAAAGAAAGTSPTGPTNTGDGNTFSVALTTGSATTTGTLFTETWANSGAFLYPPVCRVWSSGANVATGFTYAVTYPSGPHALLTVTVPTTALTAATAYAFKVSCQ
jgi:hypothetical protein